MPGIFSKSNRPTRPGAYFNFEGVEQAVIPPAIGGIVAVPITHDWGPLDRSVYVDDLSEFKAIYGPSEDTPGYIAVKQAFQGEGLPGRGGAGVVLVHRMGAAAAAKATRALTNTTPAAALTLSARYEGTFANDLNVSVQDYAADATQTELIVFLGSTEIERFRFPDTNITDVAAQINSGSEWLTAVANITGVALTPVANQALTAGNDGSTLIAGDWTAMMTALEIERFSVFSPYDLTDAAILASLKTWITDQNNTGKRFMAVLGGALNETIVTASNITVGSALFNSENVVRIGVGSVEDSRLLDVNGDPIILSTSQLAPRIAGILAARGEAMSLTFARLAGLSILQGPTDANINSAFTAGVTVLSRDSNVASPVRIEKGLTTYTTTSDPQKPQSIFRVPKFIRTMHGIQNDMQEWAEEKVIGRLPVGNKTREFVVGETRSRLASREAVGVVQTGWSVIVDPDPAPNDDDDFVAVLIGLRFGRSTEQVFFTARVG